MLKSNLIPKLPLKSANRVSRVAFKEAETNSELEQSRGLLYKAYLKKGYIRTDREPISGYEAGPHRKTFVAKDGDEVLMTLTLILDSHLGLPMEKIYQSEINTLRLKGRKIGELSGLAGHEALCGRGMFIFLGLTRLVYSRAEQIGVDDICIAINPRHSSFYENVLLFEYLGGERPYPSVRNFPACGKRLNMHNCRRRLRVVNPRLYHFFFGNGAGRDIYWCSLKNTPVFSPRSTARGAYKAALPATGGKAGSFRG
ncbi:MAG: hypothetical protein V1736_14005 [Pseudomonadota bacterium]